MMRLRPIPASLMPSAMTVRVPVQGDYSGEYSPPVTVERVRFDTYEALARRDYKLMDGSQGLVYIDAATSSPAFELPAGSLVSVDGGQEMQVVRCTRHAGFFGEVHHWEAEVR